MKLVMFKFMVYIMTAIQCIMAIWAVEYFKLTFVKFDATMPTQATIPDFCVFICHFHLLFLLTRQRAAAPSAFLHLVPAKALLLFRPSALRGY